MGGNDANLDGDWYESSARCEAEPHHAKATRPYIGILFDCCGVYVRVYRRQNETVYTGRCPNCLRPVKIHVGPEGTNSRIFRAS
jgi:hypothetical protein